MAEERECPNCGKKFIPTCHIMHQKYCNEHAVKSCVSGFRQS